MKIITVSHVLNFHNLKNIFKKFLNHLDDRFMKIILNKTKSIAWYVSNCEIIPSRRNILVNEMQKYIDIDIYGKCGNLTCRKNAYECDKMMNTTYKFYLSFENSLCLDYMTEKVYKTMQQLIIPILFNGVKNPTIFLPPKSYIDANDFDTPEDLVKYLRYLMDNPHEYIKYFWWKEHYTSKPFLFFHQAYCELCQKMNDESYLLQKHQYADINSWFRDGTCNQTSRIKF